MSTNFQTTFTLPGCPTIENFNELCRTLNPLVEVVDTAGLDVVSNKITLSGRTPFLRKVTKTYQNLSLANPTNDIDLIQIPAGGQVHAIKLKHSAAFTGGAISAYTLSLGITGALTKYLAARNVFVAPSDTGVQIAWAPFYNVQLPSTVGAANAIGSLPIGGSYNQTEITNLRNACEALRAAFAALFGGFIGLESSSSVVALRLAASATGANLSAATAGSVDVWVLYSVGT